MDIDNNSVGLEILPMWWIC